MAAIFLTVSCTREERTIKVESMSIDPVEASLIIGEHIRLNAVITPDNATDSIVIWSSGNESVATVTPDGSVTGVSVGEAVITATLSGGSGSATCTITVAEQTINITPESLEMVAGDIAALTASVSPEDTECTVEWSSSDTDVVIVDSDGNAEVIGPGQAEITAVIKGTDTKDAIPVTVIDAPEFGDYFYSDGTWSTELDESKTCVGLVFWTGNPAADDKLLAQEHPECTHGLIMCLDIITKSDDKFEDIVTWNEKCDSNLCIYGLHWDPDKKEYIDGVATFANTMFQDLYAFEFGFGYTDEESFFSKYKGNIDLWRQENCPQFESTAVADVTRLDKATGYQDTRFYKTFNQACKDIQAWKHTQIIPIAHLERIEGTYLLPPSTSGWFYPSAKELYLLLGDDDKNPSEMLNGEMNKLNIWEESNIYRLNDKIWPLFQKGLAEPIPFNRKSSDRYKDFLFEHAPTTMAIWTTLIEHVDEGNSPGAYYMYCILADPSLVSNENKKVSFNITEVNNNEEPFFFIAAF